MNHSCEFRYSIKPDSIHGSKVLLINRIQESLHGRFCHRFALFKVFNIADSLLVPFRHLHIVKISDVYCSALFRMADLGREAAPAPASDLQDIRLLGADHATTLSNTIEANEDASSMWFGFIPHEEMDPEYIDSVIANQMYQISDSDRKLAYLDVHGVAEPIEETQALVEGGLNQLERELKTLSGRAAYDLAESMDPTYTQKRDLRIAFLRTELFDGKKAALRIRRHFQMKLEFFGRDKLVMDITQDDLGKDDMGALYSGCCHVLESRDRGGRKVLLNVTPKSNRFPTHSLVNPNHCE